ncbi:dynamin-1-like protein [Frankliniella occidentalis]|uniref:Dynamin-1-like protein n=1 Tax=Frankliniella occidentalis TaxID=133901 RepID=A0A6J1SUA0_FRAOC|nr:dynamin-1-like protein [Frankliniella occidentalis]
MDDLIFSINNIQDQFKTLSQKPVDLPQIVVVGSQSTGKSSVLESIVRRSFLPRGSGIVTRCPLILRLVNCPVGDELREERGSSYEEWGEFDDDEEESKIYEIEEIESEIERRTAELAGENKNISSKPIVLKIFSPHVLTLTLVDLPGITKVAVGDQPEDIEEQIVNLINAYINNPMSIILAVITANTDMATNECIKMARKVDPEGERTLAVVTKLDLMDKGTDATEILTGMCIAVKLGIIGVVNRSQKDIKDKKSIEDALKDEEDFLRSRYPELAHKNGSAYLAKMLQNLLIRHIKTCLPEMKASFVQRLEECMSVLNKCGDEIVDEKGSLHHMISTFSQSYCKVMKGESVDMDSMFLNGGAKLCYIFKNLENELTSKKPCDAYCREKVILTIRQTSGPEPPMIFSEQAFEELMRPLITTMRLPSMLCIEKVAEELKEVCRKSISKDTATRFPKAATEITTVVNGMIDDLTETTKRFVNQAILIEEGHITHSHFLKFRNESLQKILKEEDEAKLPIPFKSDYNFIQKAKSVEYNVTDILKPTLQDIKHAMIIGEMLNVYYTVVANRIQDTVTKATMTCLVNGLEKNMLLELAAQLQGMAKKLFKEDVSITFTRKQKQRESIALKNSLKELDALDYEMANKCEIDL